jgi:hypothetical protein
MIDITLILSVLCIGMAIAIAIMNSQLRKARERISNIEVFLSFLYIESSDEDDE